MQTNKIKGLFLLVYECYLQGMPIETKRELEAKEITKKYESRKKSSDNYTKFKKDDDYQGFVFQTDATLKAHGV